MERRIRTLVTIGMLLAIASLSSSLAFEPLSPLVPERWRPSSGSVSVSPRDGNGHRRGGAGPSSDAQPPQGSGANEPSGSREAGGPIAMGPQTQTSAGAKFDVSGSNASPGSGPAAPDGHLGGPSPHAGQFGAPGATTGYGSGVGFSGSGSSGSGGGSGRGGSRPSGTPGKSAGGTPPAGPARETGPGAQHAAKARPTPGSGPAGSSGPVS